MIKIIGGGLAGCEAAYQLLKRGFDVTLYEMKPIKFSPAHKSGHLAELVCSNSLKSKLLDTASGLLKEEMKMAGSLIVEAGEAASIPAGAALAVDKDIFSKYIENKLNSFNNFKIVREEINHIKSDENIIIATGPLTSDSLSEEISRLTGNERLFFYDAVAPVIMYDSIDLDTAFFSSRYGKGSDDYLNCPMNKAEYDLFYRELVNAESVEIKDFDRRNVFEGCMPVEVMARRGYDAIRFGPLRPVGIRHPETNKNYYAVVQLRKENKSGTMYNMVGFQTNLTFYEQKRVFSLIPGLSAAEFARYGVMHRNTFIKSPELLDETFRLKGTNVYFAGQITGVEGYVESAMSGMMAAINMSRRLKGLPDVIPNEYTITGALSRYISCENKDFQPMNANFGILPQLKVRDKSKRKSEYSIRSVENMKEYIKEVIND